MINGLFFLSVLKPTEGERVVRGIVGDSTDRGKQAGGGRRMTGGGET